jgi:hypothetical protein
VEDIFLQNRIITNKKKSTALLGSSGMSAIAPPTFGDDNYYAAGDIGFNFPFYALDYRANIYVGANSYITFGFGSNLYTGLSSTSPGKGILIAAGDNGSLGIFVKQDTPGESFRIRFEGTNRVIDTSTKNIFWETTLFSNGNIRISTGLIVPRPTTVTMITKGDGVKLTSFSNTSDQSLLYGYNSGIDNYILL